MSEPLTPKIALLSALYIVLLLLFSSLIFFGMMWFANDVLFSILDWFNKKATFWKIVYFFAGAAFVFTLAITIFQLIGGFLSAKIFGRLPLNWVTGIFSAIFFLLNVILGIREMYLAVPSWGFWYVIEFILLSIFVIGVNQIILPIYNKSSE